MKLFQNNTFRLAFHDCVKYKDGSGGCDGKYFHVNTELKSRTVKQSSNTKVLIHKPSRRKKKISIKWKYFQKLVVDLFQYFLGCVSWEGMGYRYRNQGTDRYQFLYPDVHKTSNNGLAFTIAIMEEIYTNPNYPSGAPKLSGLFICVLFFGLTPPPYTQFRDPGVSPAPRGASRASG